MPLFEPILKEIVKYFQNNNEAKRRVLLLIKKDRQAEGWFKTELMDIFERSKLVYKYHPETTYLGDNPRTKCDFVIERIIDNKRFLIGVEVKTAFVGKQKKRLLGQISAGDPDFAETTPFYLTFYITTGRDGEDGMGGVAGDADRLIDLTEGVLAEKICLLFVYGKRDKFGIFQGRRVDPSDLPEQCRIALCEKIEPAEAELVNGSKYIDLEQGTMFGIFVYSIK